MGADRLEGVSEENFEITEKGGEDKEWEKWENHARGVY